MIRCLVALPPQVGDRIVSINGQAVEGLSHGEVVNMLKNSFGSISLQVRLRDEWGGEGGVHLIIP